MVNVLTAALVAQVLTERKKPDKTYINCWVKYKAYVDTPGNGLSKDDQGRYLTRGNIDDFYDKFISVQTWVGSTVKKYVPALQFFADQEEYPDADPMFSVRSRAVTQSLENQRAYYVATQIHQWVDAHDGIAINLLSTPEENKLLIAGRDSQCWMSFMVSYNCDKQCLSRGDTIRKIRLCDIKHSGAHGPGNPNENRERPMLSLTIKRITGAKDHVDKVRSVGMWRHRDYLRCGTGMIASSLLVLFYHKKDVLFSHNSNHVTPTWYGLYLVPNWRGYDAMYNAYIRIYAAAGVEVLNHSTHVRQAAIDAVSQGGGHRDDIGLMSKHATAKIDVSYLPEMPAPVMHIAAGFSERHGEKMYFVPRTGITFEMLVDGRPFITDDELSNLLFPTREQWLEEHRLSTVFDKSAKDFLYNTLPFLAATIVQDGIYWVNEAPTHAVSLQLFHIFGYEKYTQWATEKQEWAATQEANIHNNQIEALHAGAQAALASVHNGQGDILQAVTRVDIKVDGVVAEVQANHAEARANDEQARANHAELSGKIDMILVARNHSFLSATDSPKGGHSVPTTQGVARSIVTMTPNMPLHQYRQGHVGLAMNPPQPFVIYGEDRERMQNLVPNRQGQAPPIPAALPQTIQQVLEQHLTLRLHEYHAGIKKQWPQALQMRCSRRQYLYQMVLEKASGIRGIDLAAELQEAARALDRERGTMSVTAYFDQRKADDRATGKSHTRKRKNA